MKSLKTLCSAFMYKIDYFTVQETISTRWGTVSAVACHPSSFWKRLLDRSCSSSKQVAKVNKTTNEIELKFSSSNLLRLPSTFGCPLVRLWWTTAFIRLIATITSTLSSSRFLCNFWFTRWNAFRTNSFWVIIIKTDNNSIPFSSPC